MAPPTPSTPNTAREVEMEHELLEKLREFHLTHVASDLKRDGFFTVQRVRKMKSDAVAALALSPGDAMAFEEMRA